MIHSAATITFNESLKDAIHINVRGTKELLDLCEEMKHLCSVVVISTAYSFCPRNVIGEYFMDPPLAPKTIISMVDEIDEKILDKITPT